MFLEELYVSDFELMMHFQTFVPNANVGTDVDVNQLKSDFDAIIVCTGATWPRDLKIPGRDTDGIHFAMEFLKVSCALMLMCFILGF